MKAKTRKEILKNCLIDGGMFMQVKNVDTMIYEAMRQYSLQELTEFLSYLLKNNYCDSDVYDEPPTAIDGYLELKRKKR